MSSIRDYLNNSNQKQTRTVYLTLSTGVILSREIEVTDIDISEDNSDHESEENNNQD